MTWTYVQTTGRLYRADSSHAGTGYAGGNCGKNPEGINNHAMEGVSKVGPLPCGFYTFDEPIIQSHLGPFAIPLVPDDGNKMQGRGHFYVHGDTTPSGNASQGCIILPRAVRNEMWNSTDHRLQVVERLNDV
jgi:hypothetical protein